MSWGGLVYTGKAVTSVTADFMVPDNLTSNNDCPSGFTCTGSRAAVWVGIGGVFGNETIWQAGIEFDTGKYCNNGTGPGPCADAWYEAYDDNINNDNTLGAGSDVAFWAGGSNWDGGWPGTFGSECPCPNDAYNLWHNLTVKRLTEVQITVWLVDLYPHCLSKEDGNATICMEGYFLIAAGGATLAETGINALPELMMQPVQSESYHGYAYAPNQQSGEFVEEIPAPPDYSANLGSYLVSDAEIQDGSVDLLTLIGAYEAYSTADIGGNNGAATSLLTTGDNTHNPYGFDMDQR
jgi:hypothetical protein